MARATRKITRGVKTGKSLYGMVSTASPIATDGGVKILEMGGNAVDAAVAAAFCIGVTEPQASGLGGQTMGLLYFPKEQKGLAIDGSSRSPYVLSPTRVPPKPLKTGLKASTVPSTPAVLGYLLDHFGTMNITEVLEPAINAASEGFRISALQHRLIQNGSEKLKEDPIGYARFFRDGHPLRAGELLVQPELAFCLTRISEEGWKDFYHGEIGKRILQDMKERNGLIREADLSQIPVPIERPLLRGKFRGYRVLTFPPPGAGRVLIAILHTLANFSPEELTPGTPEAAIISGISFWNALRDRDRWPIDPSLFAQARKKTLLKDTYAQKISQRIRSMVPKEMRGGFNPTRTGGETTHISVVDREGNAVALTQSIELVFGSKRIAKNLGFFYNNYMSTFNYTDMMHPYYILPGSPPWSTVAPAVVTRKGLPRLLLGSPGSDRIPTAVAQVIQRVVDGKQSLADAVGAPRIHSTKEGHLHIEAARFDKAVYQALIDTGLKVTKRSAYSFYMGSVQAVKYPVREGKPYEGAADPRRDGTARGPDKVYTEDA